MSPAPTTTRTKLRRQPTSFNLTDADLARVKALAAVLSNEATAAGHDAPSLANTLRLALRRGLTALEAEHPTPAPKRATK
jgi:thiazole synthase ThiGH ThiG subunit